MTITIEAVYEHGVLRPKEPVVLVEGAEVRVTITPIREADSLADVIGIGEGPADGADNHDKYIYGKILP
jgi:predicted DNA-binding antitoxin AbrB/MazE fold protein